MTSTVLMLLRLRTWSRAVLPATPVQQVLECHDARGFVEAMIPFGVFVDATVDGPLHPLIASLALYGGVAGPVLAVHVTSVGDVMVRQ